MRGLPQGFVLGLVMAMGKGWWWPWGDDGVGDEEMVVVAMEKCCSCGHGEMMMVVAMGFALDAWAPLGYSSPVPPVLLSA